MEFNDHSHLDKENRLKIMANIESETSKCNLGFLPESLLMEIIRRLPVKSIFMCKCVCRQWFTLISDPVFVQFYVWYSGLSPLLQDSFWAKIYIPGISSGLKKLPSVFIFSVMHVDTPNQIRSPSDFKQLHDGDFSGDLEPIDVCYVTSPSTQREQNSNNGNNYSRYEIVALHLDIVLYRRYQYHGDKYYICNPFTEQWIALPPASRGFRQVSSGFITQVEDGILISYTVVRFNCPSLKTNILNFEVFTSETGEWKSFDVYVSLVLDLSSVPLVPQLRSTSLNGILHWLLFVLRPS